MTNCSNDLGILPESADSIPLFWPYVSDAMRQGVAEQLQTRWLGQGPAVEQFESDFKTAVLRSEASAVAVNSGTAALHLAYLLALDAYWPSRNNSKLDGEVICPVFTCTATNLPWLYLGLDIVWADIDPLSMNASVESISSLIGPRTRAISVVHYGGYPAEIEAIRKIASAHGIPVIEDAAQALGAEIDGKPIGTLSEYTTFSFQAIKHITTGDGGLLSVLSPDDEKIAKRLRWFGIDREGKQNGTWENDIVELGYKYQMTDIAARMGIAGLADLDNILATRRGLLDAYEQNLKGIQGLRLLSVPEELKTRYNHAAWLATVVIEEGRGRVRDELRSNGIESNAVHFRNDIYSTFDASGRAHAPVMDLLEDQYLCLPLHTRMDHTDVDRVCEVIERAM